MRVLHMIGSLTMGGSQAMIMSLYRAIDRQQIQFDFVLDTKKEGVYEKEVQELGGRIYYLPKFNGRNVAEVCRAWHKFFREHPEYKILHSHVRSYASLYLPIAKKYGLKTIIHSHNTSNGKGLISAGKWMLQYPLRYQADYFFGCSEIAGRWLFGEKIVRSSRYFMLKNAVNTERFSYQPQLRAQIRSDLGLTETDFVLGHIGRMHPQKNHCFLIDCFAEIAKKRTDARLMLLGDGELREQIAEQIQRLGLEDGVLQLGIRENPEKYLCAMDCLVFPSLHEGLPVVVVEAQASGLPCFVSDTVTKEVQLSELVQYLPISQGTTPWINAVVNYVLHRMDVTQQIKDSGFCVQTSVAWLCDFYRNIADQKTN